MSRAYYLLSIASVGAALAVGSGVAHGASTSTVNAPANGMFSVSPARQEIEIEPGATVTKYIDVVNRLGRPSRYVVEVNPFVAGAPGDGGVEVPLVEPPNSAVSWIRPELDEFILQDGERLKMAVKVSAPANAGAGGHYAGVFISSHSLEKPLPTSNINVVTRVGSLFLINVKGDVVEAGRISQFSAPRVHTRLSPVTFDVAFKNEGTTHVAPHGTVEVSNLFGTRVAVLPVEAWYVLPQSERSRQVTWDRRWLWGPYRATLNLTYGRADDLNADASILIWAAPWRMVAIVLLALIAFWLLWRQYLSRIHISLSGPKAPNDGA